MNRKLSMMHPTLYHPSALVKWCGKCTQCTDHSPFLPSFPGPRVAWGTKPCPMTVSSFLSLHQEMWQVMSCLRKTYLEEWKLCRWEHHPFISSAAFCQLSPGKVCCLILLLFVIGFCWLKYLSKAKFATFGSVLPLGSWIFEQSWCFQPCPDLIVCDVNPVHELLETFLIVSSSSGINVLYFIATAFGLRPFIYTVVHPLHCNSLNIICITLFGSSGSDVFTIHCSTSGCVSVWDDGYVRMLWQFYLYHYFFDLCQQKILYSAGSFPSSKAILNPPWQLPYELLIILLTFH